MNNELSRKAPIVIVTVCDNHYVPLLAALIKSIEVNHLQSEQIQIYVISDRISRKSKTIIENSISSGNLSIVWIELSQCIPKNIKLPGDHTTYPLNIYARLFIPDVIPPQFTKILYLDVDMILTTDISRLWYTELSGYCIAAVRDPKIPTVSNSWGGIANYEQFSLDPEEPYFNTGLLLIDAEKWRSERLGQKVLDLVAANKKYANYPDQYGMNVIFAGRWKMLDDTWNTFASEPGPVPALIHFTARKPIYKSYKGNPAFQKLFFEYLEKTEWKKNSLIGEGERYFKKLKNVLEKFFRFQL